MKQLNNVTEFILLVLTQNPDVQKLLFVIFTIIYFLTMAGNLFIVITIATSPVLGYPIYYFLSFLSFQDGFFSSTMTAKMIFHFLVENKTISSIGCMTKVFGMHFLGGVEIILLTVKAYDLYVAICKPLHYMITMNHWVCGFLVVIAWARGFLHGLIQTIFILWLPFCRPKVLDHFFCDLYPLLKVSCSDTDIFGLFVAVNNGFLCMLSFNILITSYVLILCSLRTHSSEGWWKAPSACASHITVVVLYFVPCIFENLQPMTIFPFDKTLAVFYIMIKLLLNPLIYTLRNAEVKNAMKKLWSKRVIWGNK